MKSINFFRYFALRIIFIFSLAMAWSYFTEFIQVTGFFANTLIQPDSSGHYWGGGIVDDHYEWGWRHYLWFWMSVSLFILACARIGFWCEWYWTQVSKDGPVDLKAPENKLF